MMNPVYKITIRASFSKQEQTQKFHEFLLNALLNLQRILCKFTHAHGAVHVEVDQIGVETGLQKRCSQCRAGNQPVSHTLACPADSLTDEDLLHPN